MTRVNVGPKVKNPTHDLALETDTEFIGLRLDGGVRAMQETGQTPTTMVVGAGGKKWGTGDPTFTEIEQSTWHGGRGLEFFHDDETRYNDSWQAMTRVPGRLMPQPMWRISEGFFSEDRLAWGSMSWHQLVGDERYIDTKFTASASYNADKGYLWIRRRGTPGTLTLEVCPDTGGDPDTADFTITKTTADITDTVSQWVEFDWGAGHWALVATTDYHLKIYGASTDNAANHWEVAVDESGTASQSCSDDASWAATSYSVYYRVVEAIAYAIAGRRNFFPLSGAFFNIDQKTTGNSELFTWDETNDDWDVTTMDAGDALSGTVKSVAVSKNIAHCARGTGGADETIFTFTSSSGTETGQDDATGGNKADLLLAGVDPTDGPQIYRFENDNHYWSRSGVRALNTDLVFGTDVEFPQGYDGLAMAFYNDQPWVRTQDALYSVANDKPSRLDVGLDAVLEPSTSKAPLLANNLFLYIGWSFSLERLYSGTLDDIGPWKDSGLPDGRQGVISAMCPGIGGIYVAIDGGSANYSAVFFTTNGRDYEEVFRGWKAGERIQSLSYQAQNGTTSPARLWIGIGNDAVYMALPDQSLNPLHDSDMTYCHEYTMTSAVHDFTSMNRPKFFKAIEVSSENLGPYCSVGVDYQVDEDVGTSTWTELTTLYVSPHDKAELNLGNKKKLKYRLRANTTAYGTPPVINAIVVTGFTRAPYKRQWNLRVKAADLQRTRTGAKDMSWSDFYSWMLHAVRNAQDVRMRTNENETDGIYVVVETGGVLRKFLNTIQHWVGGTWLITLREA